MIMWKCFYHLIFFLSRNKTCSKSVLESGRVLLLFGGTCLFAFTIPGRNTNMKESCALRANVLIIFLQNQFYQLVHGNDFFFSAKMKVSRALGASVLCWNCSHVRYRVTLNQSIVFPSVRLPSWKMKILLEFGYILRRCAVALNCG